MRLLQRMQVQADDGATAWQVPYADLMSLLLAVFVLIACMSELKAGARFEAVSGQLRAALGFPSQGVPAGPSELPAAKSLAERLQDMGARAFGMPAAAEIVTSADCDVVSEPERLIVRTPMNVAFAGDSVEIAPGAGQVLRMIGKSLAGGTARLEVRGFAGSADASEFDSMLDVSYQRGRSAAAILVAAGVSSGRISVSAEQRTPVTSSGAEAGLELVVHAVPAALVGRVSREG